MCLDGKKRKMDHSIKPNFVQCCHLPSSLYRLSLSLPLVPECVTMNSSSLMNWTKNKPWTEAHPASTKVALHSGRVYITWVAGVWTIVLGLRQTCSQVSKWTNNKISKCSFKQETSPHKSTSLFFLFYAFETYMLCSSWSDFIQKLV
jgi:hypothetical protein